MIKDASYLLGKAVALLTQIRSYIISTGNTEALVVMEDQYQSLTLEIDNQKESNNGVD
jgi:hypothetical protein